MKKLFVFALVVLLCILFSGCVSSNIIADRKLNFPENTVFYINTLRDNKGVYTSLQQVLDRHSIESELVTSSKEIPKPSRDESSGTAFFIAPDILVTNAHVIDDDKDIVFIKDGVEEKAELLYKNTQNDLAFLQTRKFDMPYFRLAKQSGYDITQSIYVLGYPLSDILGNEIRVTNGIINSLSGIGGDSNNLQISAQIQPGNSGGPVIDDSYNVVGVASSKLSDSFIVSTKNTIAQNVNFAIKSNIVALFGEEFISPENLNYVDSMNDAIKATVKVSTGSNFAPEGKYYYLEFGYDASWDVIHYTAESMFMNCYDVETGELVASTNQDYFSFSSVYDIAKSQMEEILIQLN
jgi:S1-C subfamily serine protease